MENKIENVSDFLEWLYEKMEIAIQEENYEYAAICRDLIIKYKTI